MNSNIKSTLNQHVILTKSQWDKLSSEGSLTLSNGTKISLDTNSIYYVVDDATSAASLNKALNSVSPVSTQAITDDNKDTTKDYVNNIYEDRISILQNEINELDTKLKALENKVNSQKF